MWVKSLSLEIFFGTNNKACETQVYGIKTCKVKIPTIHHINGSWFWNEFVRNIDIMYFAISNFDEGRNATTQINERMQLYSAFLLSKSRPRKERKTQVDRCRIKGINRLVGFYAKFVILIKFSCDMNQNLSKITVDALVSVFICMGKITPRNVTSNSHMIKFLFHWAQASFDISEAFSVGQLSKCHTQKLFEAWKTLYLVVAIITLNTFTKFMHR